MNISVPAATHRIIDHLKWAEALAVGTMLFGEEFHGQLDHTKCKFGEWYYSYKPPQELEGIYRKLEEPHKKLHATAAGIVAAVKAKKPDAAMKIYKEETVPYLAATQEGLIELRGGFKELVGKMTAELGASQKRMGAASLTVYASVLVLLLGGAIVFLVRPLRKGFQEITQAAEKVSAGDTNVTITTGRSDEIGELLNAMKNMVDTIKALVADANMLAQAAVEGRLATRADAGRHQGEFRRIVEGVNATLDAVVDPLNVAAKYVEKISRGELPPKIADDYKGDFNEIKNSLNIMIENLTRFAVDLQAAADQVAAGSQELSSGSEQMSQGATEQASSVEEVSSSAARAAELRKRPVKAASEQEKPEQARPAAVKPLRLVGKGKATPAPAAGAALNLGPRDQGDELDQQYVKY